MSPHFGSTKTLGTYIVFIERVENIRKTKAINTHKLIPRTNAMLVSLRTYYLGIIPISITVSI